MKQRENDDSYFSRRFSNSKANKQGVLQMQTVEITPNYKRIFEGFRTDFANSIVSVETLDKDDHEKMHASFFALYVALQAISETSDLQTLQETVADFVARSLDSLTKKRESKEF